MRNDICSEHPHTCFEPFCEYRHKIIIFVSLPSRMYIWKGNLYIYIDVKSQRNWSPKNVYYDALALAYMSCHIYIFNVQQQHHCTRSCQPPPYQCSLQEYVAQSFRTSITYIVMYVDVSFTAVLCHIWWDFWCPIEMIVCCEH